MPKTNVKNLTGDQTLPHSMEAERNVLGAMIRDRDAVHRAAEILTEESFYQPNHQKIFSALVELSTGNTHIDLVTLADLLEHKGDLELIGGGFYLAELVNSVTTSAKSALASSLAFVSVSGVPKRSNS